MAEKLELHGWTDLVIETETMFMLTSRGYKLYSYMVFRARGKGAAFPGLARIAQDLTLPDETWSVPTAKRHMGELVAKKLAYRERRGVGKTSITHLFKNPDVYNRFMERRITGDPTDGSPAIPQSDHGRSDIKNTKGNENKDKPESGAGAPEPGKPDKQELDRMFDLICEICDLDPKQAGKVIGKVRGELLKVGWTSAGLAAFRDWRKAKALAPLGSVHWLQGELAKKSWRKESRAVQGAQPDQADIDFVNRKRAEAEARKNNGETE